MAELTIYDFKLVRDLLYEVRAKWYDIGIELGVDIGTLESVSYTFKDPGECLREVLKVRLKSSNPAPTLKVFADALRARAVGETALAEKVIKSDINSKRFPYLKNTAGNDRRVGEFIMESEEIREKFADLVIETAVSLEESVSLKLSTLKLFLSSYHTSLNDDSDKCVTDVMRRASRYWSFYSYKILQQIIKKFGSNDDQNRLETYDSEFHKYGQRRLCEIPADALKTNKGHYETALYFKTDKTFNNPLEDAIELECKLSKVFGMELHLVDVREGCVELIFSCDHTLRRMLHSLSSGQRDQLSKLGILRLYDDNNEYFCGSSISSNQQGTIFAGLTRKVGWITVILVLSALTIGLMIYDCQENDSLFVGKKLCYGWQSLFLYGVIEAVLSPTKPGCAGALRGPGGSSGDFCHLIRNSWTKSISGKQFLARKLEKVRAASHYEMCKKLFNMARPCDKLKEEKELNIQAITELYLDSHPNVCWENIVVEFCNAFKDSDLAEDIAREFDIHYPDYCPRPE